MSRPRIHGMRTYDDWKLATPPEYDELGPEPEEEESPYCEACKGEGRILRTRSGHPNDPDTIDCGPCPYCDDGLRRKEEPPEPVLEPPPATDEEWPF